MDIKRIVWLVRLPIGVLAIGLLWVIGWPIEVMAGIFSFPLRACVESPEDLIDRYRDWPHATFESARRWWLWVHSADELDRLHDDVLGRRSLMHALLCMLD